MLLGLAFFIGAAIYFLPSWIGSDKENRTAIFLVNLLLGWSLIGWVVALVWAVKKDPAPAQIIVQQTPVARPPVSLPVEPQARVNRLRELRDNGAITQAEFLDLINKTVS